MHAFRLKRFFITESQSNISSRKTVRNLGFSAVLASFLLAGQVYAATEGAGDNDTADAAGVVTVSVPDTLEGNLCREDDFISSPCAPSDPADNWSITNGTSGSVTFTWTSAVQVQLQSYVDSARTDTNFVAPVAVTSGMAETLNAMLFYSVIITPQAGDTMTAYNVALATAGGGNSAPTAMGIGNVTVTEDTLSNFDLSGVTLSDTDGDSLTVTITVTEGTFATPADGAGVGSGVDEALASSTSITLAGSAADINTYLDTASNIRYTGVNNQSGNASATFTINANDGTVNPQVGMGDVNITGVNDAPTAIGFNTSLNFATNITGVNAVLDTVGATDTDGPFPIVMSLASVGTATSGTCSSDVDNGSFNIDGTNLRSSAVLAPRVYNICVQAADMAMPSLSFEQTFAITIVPVEATSTAAGFNSVTGANLTPSFNFGDNDETLTVADPSHITGSNMNGRGGSDILVVPNGSDLTTGNVTQIETLQIASGATVTMTEAQYELFSTITAPGTETLVLGAVDDGSVTANDNIENYQLNGAYTFNPAPLGNGVTVTGDSSVQTFNVSDGSDTYTGGGGNDIFRGSSSALASDTITDLSVGDVIVITGELIGAADVALSGDGNTIEIKSNPSLPADVFIGLDGMGNVAINTVSNDGMDTTITFSTPVSNAAPIITEGDNIELVIDLNVSQTSFPLSLNATDSDSGDTLTWSVSSTPSHGIVVFDSEETGNSVSLTYGATIITVDDLEDFPGDSFDIQVTDDASTPASGTITVTVLTIPQKALNDIADYGLASMLPSESPDTATYTRAGVTGVTDGAVLDLINNAVRMIAQSSGPSMDISAIDTAAELQVIVNAILEGQDADGDGLPNIFEGSETVDTDGDGVPDRRDTDSDNDGIGDIIDSGLFLVRNAMTNEFTLDVADIDNDNIADVFDADINNDGSLDSPVSVDDNYDGVDDRWDTVQEVLDAIRNDTDDDGVPALIDGDDNDANTGDAMNLMFDDFRQLMIINGDGDNSANYVDLDADNDGVLDVNEYGTSGARDQNMDALIDSGQQVVTEIQPLIDLGVAINADNDDDLVNHLDVISDGSTNDIESVFTAEERLNSSGLGVDVDDDGRLDSTIDFDRDGIVFFIVTANSPSVTIDNSEVIYGLRVPIETVSLSPVPSNVAAGGWWAVVVLASLLVTRMRKVVLFFTLLGAAFSSFADSWNEKLQWQVAVGQSEFNLDLSEAGFAAADERDHQYSLALGYQFHDDWAAQIKYSDLGGVNITNNTDTASVDYEAYSFNVLATLPILEESPIDVYSVLGVVHVERDSEVIIEAEDDATNATLGLGVKGQIERATVSVEFNTYTEEAWVWSVGIGGHF